MSSRAAATATALPFVLLLSALAGCGGDESTGDAASASATASPAASSVPAASTSPGGPASASDTAGTTASTTPGTTAGPTGGSARAGSGTAPGAATASAPAPERETIAADVAPARTGAAPRARATAPPAAPVAPGPRAGRTLDGAAFADRAGRPDTVVLDVRTPEEFASGHLPDAVNLDVTSTDFDAGLPGLDRNVTYAVYCRSGHRSTEAMNRMAAAGFGSLAELGGGIESWTAAGRPVVTGN